MIYLIEADALERVHGDPSGGDKPAITGWFVQGATVARSEGIGLLVISREDIQGPFTPEQERKLTVFLCDMLRNLGLTVMMGEDILRPPQQPPMNPNLQ